MQVGEVPSSSRVIRGFYALTGLYTLSAAAIWGVNTLFLLKPLPPEIQRLQTRLWTEFKSGR